MLVLLVNEFLSSVIGMERVKQTLIIDMPGNKKGPNFFGPLSNSFSYYDHVIGYR
jgi:hypothetical protein